MGNLKQVVDVDLGIYVWKMPNGQYVGDEDGNIMHIPSRIGDITKMKALADAARYYGVGEGRAVFIPGGRAVTDSEYEDQAARAKEGLTPDPYDVGALKDELAARRERRN